MKLATILRFTLPYVLIGLLSASVVLWLFRDQGPVATVVEVQSVPSEPALATGYGPVSYADAVSRAVPAVVNIYAAKIIRSKPNPLLDDPLFQYLFGNRIKNRPKQRLETSLGSGVIINEDGYVLTNHHVIGEADEIRVSFPDGRDIDAKIVGIDPDTDLAVLKIKLKNLPYVRVMDSERLRVGDVVLAIGNPFGVGQTVTQGIVSAKGRSHLGINTFEDFIQTDAAINPGNSGGALINARGELVGINTAIFSKSGGSQGIGFAIPSALAINIAEQIIRHGHVVRGWLGIEGQDLSREEGKRFGLNGRSGFIVTGIYRDGPAHRGKLQPGDVVVQLNGQAIQSMEQALTQVATTSPGEKITLAGLRNKRVMAWSIKVAERPVLPK